MKEKVNKSTTNDSKDKTFVGDTFTASYLLLKGISPVDSTYSDFDDRVIFIYKASQEVIDAVEEFYTNPQVPIQDYLKAYLTIKQVVKSAKFKRGVLL